LDYKHRYNRSSAIIQASGNRPEGDDIWSFGQVEVFVGPHLARWASSCLDLVHQERGPVVLADLLKGLNVGDNYEASLNNILLSMPGKIYGGN